MIIKVLIEYLQMIVALVTILTVVCTTVNIIRGNTFLRNKLFNIHY